MNVARYDINKSVDGQYYFNLKAPNYKIIATSEMYKTKASAWKAVEAVQIHATTRHIKDNTLDKA